MIYDCFSFFNELDLLEIRLNVLKDVVDRFVLVEAGETHTGKPKPLYYKENESRFAGFRDRIEYVCIDRFPPVCKTSWARENYQRNAIAEGLVSARDEDVILISDLDEIPRPEKIRTAAALRGVKIFDQDYYSFYLNYRNVRQQYWYGTRMVSYRDFRHVFDGVEGIHNEFLPHEVNAGTTASKIRCWLLPRSLGGQTFVRNGGWHFTCLGGAAAVLEKMRAVVPHHDFNPDDLSLTVEVINRLIAQGRGPALKMNCYAVDIDDTYPAYLQENSSRYPNLIFVPTAEYLARVKWLRRYHTLQGYWLKLAENACPRSVHNLLHQIKMKMLGATS